MYYFIRMRLTKTVVLRDWQHGFTLVELLGVLIVIVMLASVLISVAGYVHTKAQIQTTRSFLFSIETALEAYKTDNGYYPLTGLAHFSLGGGTLTSSAIQITNSCTLYRALTGVSGGRKYMNFRPNQFQSPTLQVTYIVDIFGRALNYYCIRPPTSVLEAVQVIDGLNQTNVIGNGGQVRTLSFDLFSNGPDTFTYIPFTNSWTIGILAPWVYHPSRFSIMSNDDIWCSKK